MHLSAARRIPTLFLVICLYFAIVDGFLSQIQILLFGGRIILPDTVLKTGIIILFSILLFLSIAEYKQREWFRLIALIACICLIAILVLYFMNTNPRLPYVELINTFILPVMFLFISTLISIDLKRYYFDVLIFIIAIPSIFFGILQILNPDILPNSSIDGRFLVLSTYFAGDTRVFSLFGSPYNLGISLVFIIIISTTAMMQRKWVYTLILVPAVLVAYFTYTRNIYISSAAGFILAISYSYIAKLERRRKLLCSLIVLTSSIFLSFWLPSLLTYASRLSNSSIVDTTNLDSRVATWNYWLDRLSRLTGSEMIFGTGFSQRINQSKYFLQAGDVIDNNLLAIIAGLGLIGIAIWLFLFMSTWIYAAKRLDSQDNTSISGVSLLTTSFFLGQFNILPQSLFFLAILCIFAVRSKEVHTIRAHLVRRDNVAR